MMKENLSQREKEFKSILEGTSLELDTQNLWDEIEGSLPPQRRKRPFAFFGLGVVALVTLLSAGLLFINLSTDNNTPNLADNQVKVNNNFAQSNTSTSPSETTIPNTESIAKQADNIAPIITKNNSKASTIEPTTNLKNPSQKTTINKTKTIANSKPSISQNLVIKKVVQKTLVSSPMESINRNITSPIALNKNANTRTKFKTLASRVALDQSALIPLNKLSLIPLEARLLEDKEPTTTPINIDSWNSYLVLRAGVNRALSSNVLNITNTDFDPAAFDLEKDLYGISTDLIYKIDHSSSWSIGLGLNYAKLTTQYRNQSTQEITVAQDGTVIVIDPDGQPNEFQTSLNKPGITLNDITWHRHHSYLNAALYLSKKMLQNRRISIEPELALGINLIAQHRGYYFDEALGFTKMNASTSQLYKKNTGLNAQIGCLLATRLGALQIGVLPYLRYNPQDITKPNNFYSLKNSQYGLQISVAYQPN